jgi:Arylsulfotransferase (ASST)
MLRWLLLPVSFALLAPAALAAPALHVVPFPGTPDASPNSPVIFSSVRPAELTSVTVNGSSSGLHTGHIAALPDGAGTAFVPYHPFTPGEQVQVVAGLSSAQAGTASGDPGATTLSFSFVIAVAASTTASDKIAAPLPSSGHLPWESALSRQTGPAQSFHSAPNLHPPVITASSDPDTASGDIFLTPSFAQPAGPMILDGEGRLVWFWPVGGNPANLEVQRYHGQPALTFSETSSGAGPRNSDVIMNRHYEIVSVLHAAEGYADDPHEFQLTPKGSALIAVSSPVMADLSSVGGATNGSVADCIVQELDIRTGQLLWEWHMLGHVPLTASFAAPPYDYCHLNSIQRLPNGNLLISARNTWAVYEIDKQTGRVLWTLGGKDSNFHIGPGANFEWQHDAHLTGDTLSLFNDASYPQEETQSSAKILRLNTTTMTASLVRRYTHSPPTLSSFEGSMQVLPNGNVFVGWGIQPVFSEYTPSGRQIFNGVMPLEISSYRAYRFAWHGYPLTRPSLASAPQGNGSLSVYASWNGATDVAAWRVLGGSRPGALHPLAKGTRSGFETRIVVRGNPDYVAVQALGVKGKVLGTSRVTKA